MEKYDTIEIYCKSLGHYVPFKYCRSVKEGLPCHRIKDCTYEKIPIIDYLKENYSEEEMDAALAPPQNKMVTLIELIEKAKTQC